MPPKQPANGKSQAKPKQPAVAPVTASTASEGSKPATSFVTKPDATAFHAEQDALKKEIDEYQAKLNAVKEKIALAKGTGGNERRDALRAELDAIRGQQGNNKASRSKLLEQIQTMQAGIQTKVKALQAARGKTPYKTVDDVNAQIAKLDNLVNSGTMKIVDERKTLTEISNLKRLRKTVEGFQAEQDSIEKDRAEVDNIRKQLDDPEMKAVSEKYETIKAELDSLKKESDTAYEGRTKLFDERTELQTKIETLWKKKRDAQTVHRESNDAYWKKVNEDRARRAEKAMVEKKAYEESKRREIAEEMLESAKEPAYAADIQDCQTLIDYFSRTSGGGGGGGSSSSAAAAGGGGELYSRAEVAGVPKLELRKVGDTMEGMAPMKKKGQDENNYFVAKKGKKVAPAKAYGSATAPAPPASASTNERDPSTAQLNIPFGTLSGLMALSIPPPTNVSEVPRVIEDLKTKKAWYQANQARVTKENVAKAEAAIEKLNKAAAAAPKPEVEKEPEASTESAAAVEASA